MIDGIFIAYGVWFRYKGSHAKPSGEMRAEYGFSFQKPLMLQRFSTGHDVVAQHVTLPAGFSRTTRNDEGNTLQNIERDDVRLHFWFDHTVRFDHMMQFRRLVFTTLRAHQLEVPEPELTLGRTTLEPVS